MRDDGVGGAVAAAAVGCAGSPTGVGALDGTLELESAPGAGTLVRARVPLRSAPDEGEHG